MSCRVRFVAAMVLVSLPIACRPTSRYTVTTTPLNLIGPGHPGHCIAIDPTDPRGVWTWEPAGEDCSRRSTGPGILRADQARVTATASGAVEVHFQIQLQVRGPLDVNLVLQDGVLRNAALGTQAATALRSDLNVPDRSLR